MKKPPMISVIVPIYNTSAYLDRCIESISRQTFKDLEIILINDGSTDGSQDIIEHWRRLDSRIISITQTNKGQANARNKGMEIATAKYIGFADSDDYLEPEMYEKMHHFMETSGADILQCDQNIVPDTGYDNKAHLERMAKLSSGMNGFYYIHDEIVGNAAPWNKLYKSFLINIYGLKFPDGLHGPEDDAFHWFYITLARTIYFLDEKLYNYVQREGSYMSLMNEKKCENPLETLYAMESIYYHLVKFDLVVHYKEQYLKTFAYFYKHMLDSLTDDQKPVADELAFQFLKRHSLIK